MTIIVSFYPFYERLKFSQSLKDKNLILTHGNTVLTNPKHQFGHRYAVVDMDPVTSGIHCWRIQVNKSKFASITCTIP